MKDEIPEKYRNQLSLKDKEIAELEEKLANAQNETLDKAIKLCDDEITYEEYVKNQQTEPFKAMVQFGIARLGELKSALIAMKKETK